MGGYPIGNMDTQYKTTYSLIVKEFLAYPKDTPEKEFCKAKWYVETSRLYGDLIHNEEYERAQIEVLKKEQKRLQEEVKKANVEIGQLKSIINNKKDRETEKSKIHLSADKGKKIDYIRVINCLYELGFFKDDKDNDISKKDVFEVFGVAVNKDLSAYQNDLSATKSAANKDMASVIKIFQTMLDKQNQLNNKK
jgi:hypothetical protein